MSASDLLAEEAKQQSACHEQGGSPPVATQHKDLTGTMSMRRSWSNDSLTNAGVKTCVCAPTTHAGSFRCRLHRVPSNVAHAHAAAAAASQSAAPLPPPAAPPSRASASATSIEAR